MTFVSGSIGASVVDYIHRNNNSLPSSSYSDSAVANDVEQDEESTVRRRSLIELQEGDCNNVLLRGPPQSGKTSIVMDMAHFIAASPQCRGDCGSSAAACHCVSVAILVCSQELNRFPLPCEEIDDTPLDLPGQLRALEQTPRKSWNKAALRRIQIHRTASTRDVMEYLLGIQSKPPGEQPIGGIIVEDVDCLARGVTDYNNGTAPSSRSKELTTEQLMTMTHILALLADTANSLRWTTNSCVIMATVADVVPYNVNRLLWNWFPAMLSIRSSSASKQWKPRSFLEGENVDCNFVLETVGGFTDGQGKESVLKCQAEYAMIRRVDGTHRIAWKRSDSAS